MRTTFLVLVFGSPLLLLGNTAFSFQIQPLRPSSRASATASRITQATASSLPSQTNNAEQNDRKSVVDKSLLDELNQRFDYDGRMTNNSRNDDDDDDDDYRCGFVAILGPPNAGKSTLLNALLQEDLCIATARPQTTRHAILGILSMDNAQVCLVDTPGVIGDPAYKLQEGMMEAVVGAYHDADVLLVVTDVFSTPIPDDALFRKVQQGRKPVIVVVNKIDLASKVNKESDNKKLSVTPEQAVALWRQLLPEAVAILPATASQGPEDPGVVALRRMLAGGPDVPAALRGLGRPIQGMFPDGVKSYTDDQLRNMLLPISPPLYDTEILTDRTERFVASEIIREALFLTLRKELPYCCEVRVTEFKEPKEGETKKPITRISADIVVERDSQKLIVIGKNGEQIKNVGTAARIKLEDFLQCKVFLNLSVRVNKDWRKSEDKLKAYGYLS